MIGVGLKVFQGSRTTVILKPDGSVYFDFTVPGTPSSSGLNPHVCCALCRVNVQTYMNVVGHFVTEDKSYCPILRCRGRVGKGSPDGDHVWQLPGQPVIAVVKRPGSKPQFPF